MTIKASSLRGEVNVPVRLPNINAPASGSGWNANSAHKIPSETIVMQGLHKYDATRFYLSYLYPVVSEGKTFMRGNRCVVPEDFKFERLKGEEKDNLMVLFDKHTIENLGSFLGHDVTIGSDPEIFVEDKDGLLPAFKFLGSKTDRKTMGKIFNRSYGNLPIYWDGFQAEFETSAQRCLGWHTDSVQVQMMALYQYAIKHSPTARLSTSTVMEIPYELLQSSSEEHVSLGCMPSLNAYGLKGKTCAPRELPFRSAGGHIHFGFETKPDEAAYIRMVKALDAILGVACVSLFASVDNPRRREYYGLPGEYRLPPHGLEYRTLSNAWLIHPFLMNLVFDLSRKAMVIGLKDFLYLWKGSEEETIKTITTCDAVQARVILERNKHMFLSILNACYYSNNIEALYNVFINGFETIVKDPKDFVNNWRLDKGWITHSGEQGKNVITTLGQLAAEAAKKKAA